ncbi:hypothetical protein HHI36_017718 [Cryptolaemus montrouzieri]|uniref:Major facilitator superfamily (MFS) profile domain-containing protein n=1 Tax=Cryptolaemus montrouzieri TaxID=559131 RepID=A0ABD2NNR8_9CUCU
MSDSNCNVPISNSEDYIKLYKYRWIIIVIYGLFNAINYFQSFLFNVIANIIEDYYGVDETLTQLSGLVFMIAFIFIFIPVGYFIEKTSLRTASLVGAGLTALGNCLKLLAISPDSFYWILISQTICAIAQVFMLLTPSKLASVWFGAEEVSTACAIGLFGTQMVFRSKPPTPPSFSQAKLSTTQDDKMTYWVATKGFLKNKDYLIVLFTIGIGYGIWNSFGILVNQIFLQAFPDDDSSEVGILTSITCISGGCFGTMIFGYILDKTHKFKLVAFTVLLANTLASIGQAVCFVNSYKLGVMIIVPINGFFCGSLFVIGFEYAIETTYPTPEPFGAGILNAMVNISAILYVFIYSAVANMSFVLGQAIFVVSLALATVATLFISPELRRRNANLKCEINKGFDKNSIE